MKRFVNLLSGILIPGTLLLFSSCTENDPAEKGSAVTAPDPDLAPRAPYQKVISRLDTDGTILVYLETESIVKSLKQNLTELQIAMEDQLPEEASTAITTGIDLLSQTGLFEIEAFGFSQGVLKNGLYRTKSVLLRETGSNGFGWRLFGSEPHPFEMLERLPASTAFASFTDFDLGLLWSNLRNFSQKLGLTEMQAGLDQVEQSTAQFGLPWQELLAGFDNHFGVLITLDESKQATLPVGPQILEIPEPTIALVFRMRNDTVYESLKTFVSKVLPLKAVSGDGFEGVMTPVPPGQSPITLSPTLAKAGSYLVVGSTLDIVKVLASTDHNTDHSATPSVSRLVDQPAFKELARSIPDTGNAFTYLGPQVSNLMQKISSTNRDALPLRLAEMINRQTYVGRSFGVSRITTDAHESITNSEDGPERAVASMLVAPAAMAAAVAVPGFLRARLRAQATSALNELRLIDAAIDQCAIEHNLPGGTVVKPSDLQLYFKPGSSIYERFGSDTPVDTVGNPYSTFKVNTQPTLPAATAAHFQSVVDPGFWAPYQITP